MSFDLRTAIGSIAPTLATMLGGPMIGGAVAALLPAFGLSPSGDQTKDLNSITAVVQSGNMTPEIIAAVRAADQKHAEIIAQMGFDLKKLNADHEESMAKIEADTADSARKREMAVKDRTPANLAYSIIGGFMLISAAQLVALMGYPDQAAKIPAQGWLLVGNISGYLFGEAKAAAQYYFGTTSNNRSKDDTIAEIAKAP